MTVSRGWWEENLRVLQAANAELAARVMAERESGALELAPSDSGWPTARWREGGFVHSSVDPWLEARRLVEEAVIEDPDLVVAFGLGLGYHVLELFRRHPRTRALVVVEPDTKVMRVAMEAVDLRPVLGSHRVHWAVGAGVAGFRRMLKPLCDSRFLRGVAFFQHPASVRRAPAFYHEAAAAVRDAVMDELANLVTVAAYSGDWLVNKLYNVGHVAANPGVSHLFGRFTGRPAIIVAAGPSLDKNAHLLAEAKGRAVILCVDTALKALLRRGIRPDLVLSIDGSFLNYRHFEGVETEEAEGMWLVAEPATHHRILDEFRGPKLIASFETPAMRWLESVTEPKGLVVTGGSVATFAFGLAVRMGADPIIFVGQDLSYPDGKCYASGTYYAETGFRMEERTLLRVPANDGGEVPTPPNMYTFLKWFEEAIDVLPGRTFVNATEGGARIEGTRVMTLREALDRYCGEPVPVAEVLAAIPAPRPDWDRLLCEMEGLRRRLREIVRLGRRGQQLAHRLRDLVGRDYAGAVPAQVNRLLSALDRVDRRLNLRPAEPGFDVLVEFLYPLLFWLQRSIRLREAAAGGDAFPERPEERREIAERSIVLYAGAAVAAERVAGLVGEAAERVRRMAGAEVAGRERFA